MCPSLSAPSSQSLLQLALRSHQRFSSRSSFASRKTQSARHRPGSGIGQGAICRPNWPRCMLRRDALIPCVPCRPLGNATVSRTTQKFAVEDLLRDTKCSVSWRRRQSLFLSPSRPRRTACSQPTFPRPENRCTAWTQACRAARVAVTPTHLGRHAHQNRPGAAVRLQSEMGATIPDQVEFNIAANNDDITASRARVRRRACHSAA